MTAINSVLNRLGYRVSRWRPYPFIQHVEALGINLVFDVGANVGQFGRLLRVSGYSGRIVSFEPVKSAYAKLSSTAAGDSKWTTDNTGLGAEKGEANINVNQSSDVSSLLKMHEDIAARHGFDKTEIESINIVRLDDVFERYATARDCILLKLDVQGYESEVLKGATASLGKIAAVQTEMSIVPLYHGQQDMCTMIGKLDQFGFGLFDISNGFRDTGGRLCEADGLFIRRQG